MALPRTEVRSDFHCVTRWLPHVWRPVPGRAVLLNLTARANSPSLC